MATKAELENAYNQYRNACGVVARAQASFALHDAVRAAEASLPLIHPATSFQRRFLKRDEPNTFTLDCIFRYAPHLFLRASIDAAERWYVGGTRTERNALADVPDRLESARSVLNRAIELWSILASAPDARLKGSGNPSDAAILATWLSLGLIAEHKQPGRSEYARVSDPRRPTRGKCGACGYVLAIPLARLLDPYPCPACRRSSHFVLTARLL